MPFQELKKDPPRKGSRNEKGCQEENFWETKWCIDTKKENDKRHYH